QEEPADIPRPGSCPYRSLARFETTTGSAMSRSIRDRSAGSARPCLATDCRAQTSIGELLLRSDGLEHSRCDGNKREGLVIRWMAWAIAGLLKSKTSSQSHLETLSRLSPLSVG